MVAIDIMIKEFSHFKIQFHINILGFYFRNFKKKGPVADPVMFSFQDFLVKQIHAGIFFKNGGKVLGAEQDMLIMIQGARQQVPVANLPPGDGKQGIEHGVNP